MAFLGEKFGEVEAAIGYFGADVLTGTGVQTPPTGFYWYYIQNIGSVDATFTSLTGNISGGTSIVLSSGKGFGGIITALQLSAGSVIAYRIPVQYAFYR
jgi:hypothetical protein